MNFIFVALGGGLCYWSVEWKENCYKDSIIRRRSKKKVSCINISRQNIYYRKYYQLLFCVSLV
jgi:hypothetical protein